MKIALAQVNPTVGDIDGNLEIVRENIEEAREREADLVVFPELVMSGYPPMDLLPPKEFQSRERKDEFVERNLSATAEAIETSGGIAGVLGHVNTDDEGRLYNVATVFSDGQIVGRVKKTLLPTYDVFDEERYFTPADSNSPVLLDDLAEDFELGVSVCEDLWDEEFDYEEKVVDHLAELGADLLVNVNASPYNKGKLGRRFELIKKKASRHRTPFVYVNMVGGQDGIVFDGRSMIVDSEGRLVSICEGFQEQLLVVDLERDRYEGRLPTLREEEEVFRALVLGVEDYAKKSGFSEAVVGLSGGIDSSLTACVAVEALDADQVLGVYMPTRYSTTHGREDSKRLAENLGIDYLEIDVDEVFEEYLKTLKPVLRDLPPDETEENVQARVRGNVLMAISNKHGHLVLSTGNKTELALGYVTLYGDLSGGLAVLGDVSKEEVYRLARHYNQERGREVIPQRAFEKRPSAELRPGQYDPFDYSVVSPLVDEIVENRRSFEELVDMGFEEGVVREVMTMIQDAEYKRRQAPPTIKITKKAFGIGWRMPIINKFDASNW